MIYYSFSLLLLYGKEELKLRRQLFFTIKSIREVYSSDSTISMNTNSQCFNIIWTIGSSCKIRQIKLDLVPPFIQSHRHSADKRFYSGCRLIIRGSEPPSHIFIIEDLHFEGEVFFQLRLLPDVTFFMIITRNGNLMPKVSFFSTGAVIKHVVIFVPMISKTEDWISWSVSLLMCPF